MSVRKRLYVSGFVAASISYLFTVLAYTGGFKVIEWATFAAVFLIVLAGFEKFVAWAETLESE